MALTVCRAREPAPLLIMSWAASVASMDFSAWWVSLPSCLHTLYPRRPCLTHLAFSTAPDFSLCREHSTDLGRDGQEAGGSTVRS